MRKEFLLGVMGNQIVIGEFGVEERWENSKVFSASFSIGEAFDTNVSEDEIRDWWEEYWNCLDKSTKLDYLQDGEITKQDWLDDRVYESDYTSIRDCSCTDLELDYNGMVINFESIGCGQHNCRKDENFKDMVFTNKEAFDKLMELWDKYHLAVVDETIEKEVEELEKTLEPFEWGYGDDVEEFILKNLKY